MIRAPRRVTIMVVRKLHNQVYKGLIMLFICSLLADGMGISKSPSPDAPANDTLHFSYNSQDTTQTLALNN